MAHEHNKEDAAATAGRGFLIITAAKLWFMVGGALIAFGLPLIFSGAAYGQYIDITNTMTLLSMVMVTGVIQSVSKFVSEDREQVGAILRQSLRIMFVVSLVVGGGFIAAAPQIAAYRDNPELALGYRFAGVILFCYGLYSVFIGVLNGRKRFVHQAMFDICFSTLKALLVVGLAVLGLGVVGAYGGFATAAVLILLLSGWVVGRQRTAGNMSAKDRKRLYLFGAQVMLYTLVFNLIYKLDVLAMKPLAKSVLLSLGTLDVKEKVDALVGYYGLGLSISRLPWQATIAVTFVIFPMVSEVTFANDQARTRLYIRQTFRYSLLLVTAPAVALTALPHAIPSFWPAEYAPAADALVWLAPAYVCFSLFNIVNTLITSSGRATTVLLIGVLTAAFVLGAYLLILPGATGPQSILTRTAIGTLAAFAFGLILGVAALWRHHGPPCPLSTCVRVAVLAGGLVALGHVLPAASKIVTLIEAVGIGLAYLVGLVVTGEIGPEDRARLMKVLGRKRAA